MARIGAVPQRLYLGPKQKVICRSRVRKPSDLLSLESFADEWGGVYYDVVRHSCVWCPEGRRTAEEALAALAPPTPAALPDNADGAATPVDAAAPDAEREAAAVAATHDCIVGSDEVKAMMAAAHARALSNFPFCALPTTMPEPQKCACSGHCNQPGHRRFGCGSQAVVVGAKHCRDCLCALAGCLAPRYKTDFCIRHGRQLNALPVVLQCVRATREWWHEMIPCDISAYLQLWPEFRQHPVLAVLAAVLKEPTAVIAWVKTELFAQSPSRRNAEVTPEKLLESLVHVLSVVHGCPNSPEVEQLGRGGAARYTGPRAACIMFGVLKQHEEESSAAATPDLVFRLGKKLSPHCLRDDALVVLRQILDAADDTEVRDDWAKILSSGSVLEISEAARRAIAHISRKVPGTLPGKDPKFGYVLLHITRKIVLSRVSCRDAETKFDWAGVTLEDLRSMGPDERESGWRTSQKIGRPKTSAPACSGRALPASSFPCSHACGLTQ